MSEVPRFFKVIGRQGNKILIPDEIVRKCGDSLREQVCFRLPCGFKWRIGLTKSSDGEVWIDKGWPEFSKHYSIDFCHFLVFGYHGNSQFQVAIFNQSSIEIDYKSFGKEVKEEPKDDENMQMCPSPCPSRTITSGRLSPKEKSEALKRIRGLKFERPFFILHMERSHVQANPLMFVPREFCNSYLGTGNKNVILKVGDGKDKSWPVMYSFKKSDRARFQGGWKTFSQDNDLKRGDLCVFAMTKTTRSIVFEVNIYRENRVSGVGQKKTKPVSQKRNASTSKALMPLLLKSTSEEGPEGILVKKDGKQCIHIYVKHQISRDFKRRFFMIELEIGTRSEVNCGRKASEAAAKFRSKHPFFQVDFPQRSLVMSKLILPGGFSSSYIEAKTKIASLRVGERSWDVKLACSSCNGKCCAQFSSGWSAFLKDNSLGPGDSYIFELIQSDQAVFKVSIFRDQV